MLHAVQGSLDRGLIVARDHQLGGAPCNVTHHLLHTPAHPLFSPIMDLWQPSLRISNHREGNLLPVVVGVGGCCSVLDGAVQPELQGSCPFEVHVCASDGFRTPDPPLVTCPSKIGRDPLCRVLHQGAPSDLWQAASNRCYACFKLCHRMQPAEVSACSGSEPCSTLCCLNARKVMPVVHHVGDHM